MKVYIASHDKELGLAARTAVVAAGHQSVSTWLHLKFDRTEKFDEEERREIAAVNFADISNADVLLLLAGPDKYPGGKFVEAGYALALGKRVIVVGKRENMQLWASTVWQYDKLSDAIELGCAK